jgi:hypothetical protein
MRIDVFGRDARIAPIVASAAALASQFGFPAVSQWIHREILAKPDGISPIDQLPEGSATSPWVDVRLQ